MSMTSYHTVMSLKDSLSLKTQIEARGISRNKS